MKRFFALSAAAVAAATAASLIFVSPAAGQARQDPDRRSIGNYRPAPTPPPASSPGPVQTPTMQEWRPAVVPYPVFVYPPGYWSGGYPYAYPYGYPYGYRYPYYLPPVYVPAERIYGPDAARRFMGADGTVAPPAANARAPRLPADRKARDDRPAAARPTGREGLVRAGKFLGYGDNHFARQRYADAYQRYKAAVEAAPDMAEGYFRQGYALIALGRYELAAKAIKRGLEIDPGWAKSDFRNDQLYGAENQAAKRAHLDALTKAAQADPKDPDLQFLLGVFLYFDGQRDRAAVAFAEADQLGGGPHLKGFLEELAKKE